MQRLSGIVLLSFALAAAACGSGESAGPVDPQEGHAAFERRDFDTAFQLLQPLAEQGDPDAQFKVGFMYLHGRGVDRDFEEAMRWLGLAADHGHAEAQFNIALSYDVGRGVAKDIILAHMWASMAATQGYRAAAELRDDTAARMSQDEIREARRRLSERRTPQ